MQDEPIYNYGYGEENTTTKRLDLGPWIQAVVERIWLVLVVTLAVGAGGLIFALKQKDIYRATAQINVLTEEFNPMGQKGVDDPIRSDYKNIDALNTIAQQLRHSGTLLRVVRTNALTNHPAFALPAGKPTEDQAVRMLGGMLTTKVRPNTRLIEINVESQDRDLVAQAANSIASQFIREDIEQKLDLNKTAYNVMAEEAKRLQAKLEDSERKLLAYKETNKATSLEDQQNVILDNLKKVNTDYTSAKSERLQIESDLKQMRKVGNDPHALLALPSVSKDPAIVAMRAKVIDQQTLVATMTNRYLPAYPKMEHALRQLEDMKRSFDTLVLNSRESVQAAYDGAQAKEKSLEAAVKEAEEANLSLGKKGVEYNVLARQMAADRIQYEGVLKQLNTTDLAKGLEKNAIRVAEPALRPNRPYKPDRPLIIAISCLSGLLAGIGLALFLNYLDNSIKTVDDAEQLLGIPVIGSVPMDKAVTKRHSRKVLIEEPHSSCAESYRSLVASIDMTGRIEDQRVVLFTSATPSEGKTFSSVNYSIGHAQKGRKTLLIDFDLRRPSVAESFGLSKETPGVTDYLLGKDTLDGLVVPINEVPGLHVLPAGPLVPNPAEQLARPWLASLLEEARSKYDRVILDTAPLNAVADAVYLLKFSQVICLVVRSGKTPLRAVRRAIQIMQRSKAAVSGLVLNYLPERSGYGYYYYYYSGSKGYNSKGVYGSPGPGKNGESRSSSGRPKGIAQEH